MVSTETLTEMQVRIAHEMQTVDALDDLWYTVDA